MDKVWITGGTGFFGSHIAARLGDRAIVTSRDEVDLLDDSVVRRFVERSDFKKIVHAAGFVGGMQLMKSEPKRMFEENVRMGENLLDAVEKVGDSHVVLIGTALSYPEHSPIPTPESALFQGPLQEETAAYGEAKLQLFKLACERGIGFTYLIPTNMYGPRNHLEPERSNVIASLLQRATDAHRKGERELVVWGDGQEIRDFLFVEDAARAVQMALEKEPNGGVFNLGSGRETTIAELAQKICEIVGFEGRLAFDSSKGGGARRRCLDTTKAVKELGFKATTSLEFGLRKTFDWIKTQI